MQHNKIRTLMIAGGLLAGVIIGNSSAHAGASASMLSNTCAGCHGTNGVAAGPAMPTIAGMPAEHIKLMMQEWKSGERDATIMGRVAKGYSDEEIDLIAKFFASKSWVSGSDHKFGTKVDQAKAKKGKKFQKKCGKCHDDNGRSQEDDIPRVAGQWLDHLLIKMENYKTPDIKLPQPKKMLKQVDKRSLEDLKNIAHFWASQK